jgi:hypothetical protein
MTQTPHAADVVDDRESDVLTVDEVVHVPPAAAELAESIEHNGESGFIAEVPDWDAEDPLPS